MNCKCIRLYYEDGHTEEYRVLYESKDSYLVRTEPLAGKTGEYEDLIWIDKEIDTENDGLARIEEISG